MVLHLWTNSSKITRYDTHMRGVLISSLPEHKLTSNKLLLLLLLSHFSCVRLCDPTTAATRLPHPWDSPGKNIGVGCHFLLQCTKVKSEREVAQSCPTLSSPMDCSLPGTSIHGIFQAKYWSGVPLPSLSNKLRKFYFQSYSPFIFQLLP